MLRLVCGTQYAQLTAANPTAFALNVLRTAAAFQKNRRTTNAQVKLHIAKTFATRVRLLRNTLGAATMMAPSIELVAAPTKGRGAFINRGACQAPKRQHILRRTQLFPALVARRARIRKHFRAHSATDITRTSPNTRPAEAIGRRIASFIAKLAYLLPTFLRSSI